MVALRIQNFGGMIPAVDPTLLPQNAAEHSENVWIYTGGLQGFHPRKLIHTAASSTYAVYRIPKDQAQPFNYSNSVYMEFIDEFTTVVSAPTIGDTYRRFYWASTSDRPRYNTFNRINTGSAAYKLGIPAPSTAPSIVVTGGSGTNTTRSYVVTWVSEYGEEGQPSNPTTATGYINGTWTITLTPPTGAESADRNLDYARIYRTITGVSGATSYYQVAQVAIATTSYSDTALDSAVVLNPILESETWAEPPIDLQGFVTMPNGIVASWRGNEVWFCEPYRPHAWPPQYALTVPYNIIGLGTVGQSLIIATQGYPSYATGVTPASMTLARFGGFEPCLSRKSILSTPEGVYWSSPNGLVLAVPGRIENITRNLITRDDWLENYGSETINAARLGTAYYAFGAVSTGCFESTAFEPTAFEQRNFNDARSGFYLDPLVERIGVNFLAQQQPVLSASADPWTGDTLLFQSDGKLYVIDPAGVSGTREPYRWRSKPFEMPFKDNLGALRIFFTEIEGFALNPAPNISLVQTLQPDQYGLVRVYADGRHVFTREIRTPGEIMRLPSGFKADYWQFEVEARVLVREVEIASSVKELRRV